MKGFILLQIVSIITLSSKLAALVESSSSVTASSTTFSHISTTLIGLTALQRMERSCRKNEMGCLNDSSCLQQLQFCDGKPDCDDGSDEMYCNETYVGERVCPKRHHVCDTVAMCLPNELWCDWVKHYDTVTHCPDGSDKCPDNVCLYHCYHPGLPNGRYQSCDECTSYLNCMGGRTERIDCIVGKEWDDKKKACVEKYTSQTCPFPGSQVQDPVENRTLASNTTTATATATATTEHSEPTRGSQVEDSVEHLTLASNTATTTTTTTTTTTASASTEHSEPTRVPAIGECVSSCEQIKDGWYDSCVRCDGYVRCESGQLHEMVCPQGVFNDEYNMCTLPPEDYICHLNGSENTNGAEIKPETGRVPGIGDCVTSCQNLTDGKYQSAQGCMYYVQCDGGNMSIGSCGLFKNTPNFFNDETDMCVRLTGRAVHTCNVGECPRITFPPTSPAAVESSSSVTASSTTFSHISTTLIGLTALQRMERSCRKNEMGCLNDSSSCLQQLQFCDGKKKKVPTATLR